MEFASIASGSNGNCYYIGNDNDGVLIDAGVSCKQIVDRLSGINVDINKIRGVFVTHEHSDHIRGINVFCKKNNIPVYITQKTFDNSNISLEKELVRYISIDEKVTFGNLDILAFSKIHDAIEPCSFSVFSDDKKISVITDIGDKCNNVCSAIKDSDVLFLETNYDLEMLENGGYPYFLKKRITGGSGHISNNQSGALLVSHATSNLKYLFLSHLSGNNNCPDKAFYTVSNLVKLRDDLETEIIVTSRKLPSELFKI